MVDTQHLESLIRTSGKKKTYLANVLGCSRQYLHKKITNQAPFTLDEANLLCSELNITRLTDKEKIFFA